MTDQTQNPFNINITPVNRTRTVEAQDVTRELYDVDANGNPFQFGSITSTEYDGGRAQAVLIQSNDETPKKLSDRATSKMWDALDYAEVLTPIHRDFGFPQLSRTYGNENLRTVVEYDTMNHITDAISYDHEFWNKIRAAEQAVERFSGSTTLPLLKAALQVVMGIDVDSAIKATFGVQRLMCLNGMYTSVYHFGSFKANHRTFQLENWMEFLREMRMVLDPDTVEGEMSDFVYIEPQAALAFRAGGGDGSTGNPYNMNDYIRGRQLARFGGLTPVIRDMREIFSANEGDYREANHITRDDFKNLSWLHPLAVEHLKPFRRQPVDMQSELINQLELLQANGSAKQFHVYEGDIVNAVTSAVSMTMANNTSVDATLLERDTNALVSKLTALTGVAGWLAN